MAWQLYYAANTWEIDLPLHWDVFMHLNLEWDCDLDYNRQRMEHGILEYRVSPKGETNREGRDEVSES